MNALRFFSSSPRPSVVQRIRCWRLDLMAVDSNPESEDSSNLWTHFFSISISIQNHDDCLRPSVDGTTGSRWCKVCQCDCIVRCTMQSDSNPQKGILTDLERSKTWNKPESKPSSRITQDQCLRNQTSVVVYGVHVTMGPTRPWS